MALIRCEVARWGWRWFISRNDWRVLLILAASAGLLGGWCGNASGQTSATAVGRTTMTPLNPAKPKTYRDVLVYGLQAKLPTELTFVDSVVAAVEGGQLPAQLVDQAYFWARTRSGSSLFGRSARPIIYFIPVMEAMVTRLRLDVELAGGLP